MHNGGKEVMINDGRGKLRVAVIGGCSGSGKMLKVLKSADDLSSPVICLSENKTADSIDLIPDLAEELTFEYIRQSRPINDYSFKERQVPTMRQRSKM